MSLVSPNLSLEPRITVRISWPAWFSATVIKHSPAAGVLPVLRPFTLRYEPRSWLVEVSSCVG